MGEASYAAVPHLVRIAKSLSNRDWNFYGLVSTIEIERHRKSNPTMPGWLVPSYVAALQQMLDLALFDLRAAVDSQTILSMLGAIALIKGETKLGALISYSDESQVEEIIENRDEWSKSHTERKLGD